VVHASVFRFEGQLTTFVPFAGPCYRCLYPTPPPPELAPGCSVAGVLGVVPGILGLLQANEALKVLLGMGNTLAGRLLLFDALETEFTELQLRRDPNCPVCSDGAVEARLAGRPFTVDGVGVEAPFLMTMTGLAGPVSPEARA
jgi:molybdopterin/thiamine biosynthesis adenylyltransferase